MLRRCLLLTLIMLGQFVQIAWANLTIEITQGVDKPIPIAVVPFTKDPGSLDYQNLPDGISGVVDSDLKMSGRFTAMPNDQMPSQPHELSQFSWSQWNHLENNPEYVVIGKLSHAHSKGKYNISFQLISMLGSRPLVGEVYENVPTAQLRALAHHISDKIYYAITGKRGIFSTRLSYVEVLRPAHSLPVYQLMIADADGYNPQSLIKQVGVPIASPVWSPDGQAIAYVTYLNNRMTVSTITLATGKQSVIAEFPGINSAPAWSPNGKSMALALSMGKSSRTNLYLMDLTTKKYTKLSSFGNNTSPVWAPNGKTLAFNSNRGGSPQIYELNLKSRQVSRITYQGIQNFDPVFTPDGKALVFMQQAYSGGPLRIAKIDLTDDKVTTLTKGELDKSPSVAPNGEMVVYANYDQKHGRLAEVSIDGRIHLNLPASHGSVQSPAWSPFLS